MKRAVFLVTAVLSAAIVRAQSGVEIDLANATIADINRAFNAGTLTAEQLTESYLARIAAYDKHGPRSTR
jgi:amidase